MAFSLPEGTRINPSDVRSAEYAEKNCALQWDCVGVITQEQRFGQLSVSPDGRFIASADLKDGGRVF